MNLHEAYARLRVVGNTIERLNNLNNRMYLFQELIKDDATPSQMGKHLTDIVDALEDLERERVCRVTLTIKGETKTIDVEIVDQKLFDNIIIFMEDYSRSLVESVKKCTDEIDLEEIKSIGDKTINLLKEFKTFLDNVYEQLCEIGERAIVFIDENQEISPVKKLEGEEALEFLNLLDEDEAIAIIEKLKGAEDKVD